MKISILDKNLSEDARYLRWNERGLPSIDLFVLVICEDKSELTIGDSGGVGDRSAHVSREHRVEYDISIVHLFL